MVEFFHRQWHLLEVDTSSALKADRGGIDLTALSMIVLSTAPALGSWTVCIHCWSGMVLTRFLPICHASPNTVASDHYL